MKVRSHGLSTPVVRDIAILCAAVFITSVHTAQAGINVWTSHGPGVVPINALAVDPTTPGTLYAVTSDYYGGDIFKTTDAGGTWINMVGLVGTNRYVAALAIDPTTPGTLYVVTYAGGGGQGQGAVNGLRDQSDVGVFKSTDGGGTWSAANTGLPDFGVSVLAIDPTTPGTLYAGVGGENGGGVFKSTNGGNSWTATSFPGLPVFDPTTPSTLYAGTGSAVFKSTDAGGSWGMVNTGSCAPCDFSEARLAIDPTTTLYAVTRYGNVFKSTDGSGSWSRIAGGVLPVVNTLAFDPTPGTLYAGTGGGVYKSTDGGSSWHAALPDVGVSVLAIDPLAPGTLYAGGYPSSGVLKSTDSGGTWSAANTGLPSPERVAALAIDPTTASTLYAGTAGAVFKSTNAGESWSVPNTGFGASDLAVDPLTSGTLYAWTNYDVFKSTDASASWSRLGVGFSRIFILAIDPTTPGTLYAGTGEGVAKSTNGGGTWSWPAFSTGLPMGFKSALAIDPVTPSTLYIAAIDESGRAGVFKSIDGGSSWHASTNTYMFASGLAIDPTTPSTLYAGTNTGVFKSTDGGGTWSAANTGLPVYNAIGALALDTTTPGTLYVGTGVCGQGGCAGAGVYKSTDGGENWNAVNTGLPDHTPVTALVVDPTTPGRLYAGTDGGGVFDIEQVSAEGVVGTGTAASCTDAALNAALAGGGLVTFNCGGPATIDISTGTGTKTIAADTTIDGGGLITISGGGTVQVFSVNAGVNLSVEHLTIANGNSGDGEGGGISNGGTLTATDSTFTHNSASNGGGISTDGTLTVAHSTFTGNYCTKGGCGIFNTNGLVTVTDSTFSLNDAGGGDLQTDRIDILLQRQFDGSGIANEGGTIIVSNCTFAGNFAGGGGTIANNEGTVTVTNSTFTDNSASEAGGISNGGTLTVANSTFTGNTGGLTGGIYNRDASVNTLAALRNTIVANNRGGNCSGSITDGGYNLDDGMTCGFSTTNGSLSNTDPQLDPAGLQDNGGPTQTVALCTAVGVPAGCTAASPAIDTGDQTACAMAPVDNLDQRGFVRPGTGHTQCSIGAYEADASAPVACVGDCGGTQSVSVSDLITLVNIALGTAQLSACPHGVASGTAVDVTMIIQAVNNALSGCGIG